MKLLYGTGNPAKLSAMQSSLERLGIELIGLNDLKAEGKIIPNVAETGNTLLENARIKAKSYYEAFYLRNISMNIEKRGHIFPHFS